MRTEWRISPFGEVAGLAHKSPVSSHSSASKVETTVSVIGFAIVGG
jgi:hypothetical protein